VTRRYRVGLSIPLWPTAFVIPLGLCFYYFLLAGSRTFEIDPDDDLGSGIAQFSFLVTGTLGTILLGYRANVTVWNAVVGAVLMAGALALYEWARQTILERRFHIAWNGGVPETVCEAGPYRHVRDPLYASYMLAFAAQLVAVPSIWAALIFLINLGLFTHAALHDERSLARSDLAEAYAGYRRRTGMFWPRLGRKPAV
jgi:protein-S-isoprenylcysteine O-methyltransferase Ste14